MFEWQQREGQKEREEKCPPLAACPVETQAQRILRQDSEVSTMEKKLLVLLLCLVLLTICTGRRCSSEVVLQHFGCSKRGRKLITFRSSQTYPACARRCWNDTFKMGWVKCKICVCHKSCFSFPFCSLQFVIKYWLGFHAPSQYVNLQAPLAIRWNNFSWNCVTSFWRTNFLPPFTLRE